MDLQRPDQPAVDPQLARVALPHPGGPQNRRPAPLGLPGRSASASSGRLRGSRRTPYRPRQAGRRCRWSLRSVRTARRARPCGPPPGATRTAGWRCCSGRRTGPPASRWRNPGRRRSPRRRRGLAGEPVRFLPDRGQRGQEPRRSGVEVQDLQSATRVVGHRAVATLGQAVPLTEPFDETGAEGGAQDQVGQAHGRVVRILGVRCRKHLLEEGDPVLARAYLREAMQLRLAGAASGLRGCSRAPPPGPRPGGTGTSPTGRAPALKEPRTGGAARCARSTGECFIPCSGRNLCQPQSLQLSSAPWRLANTRASPLVNARG